MTGSHLNSVYRPVMEVTVAAPDFREVFTSVSGNNRINASQVIVHSFFICLEDTHIILLAGTGTALIGWHCAKVQGHAELERYKETVLVLMSTYANFFKTVKVIEREIAREKTDRDRDNVSAPDYHSLVLVIK